MADSEVVMTDSEDLPVEENATNMTGRKAASTEGLVVAYTILFLMAVVPILIGAIRSVAYHHALKVVKKEKRLFDAVNYCYILSFPRKKERERTIGS